jgi:hypothetical protein
MRSKKLCFDILCTIQVIITSICVTMFGFLASFCITTISGHLFIGAIPSYTSIHAQHLDCACIFFEDLNVESRINI